ncbi:integrin beta-8-like isoform X2 [Megalops cyprinoides]|uniref:integrin beta-8-like isoform X2 n=1 Tax=Megalops cyprinoides TaxID=118141 RepID=UPI001864C689|nr:integrin beta-8-like isoform X2 [Megalops cyprinoides]
MTSWLRKYCLLHRVVFTVSVTALLTPSLSDNGCASPSITTCNECLYRGPECGWCFQEGFLDGAQVNERCDIVANLVRKGCKMEFIDHPEVIVEVDTTQSSVQVTPREITIQIRPGSEASFILAVQQLDRYPVDMYYLVDVSASMQDNLDRLKSVGIALSQRMKEYSSDFRVGFGSFVDKPVSPYINVHPSKITNPCSDYDIQCRPAHGFIHVLPVTENVTEFTRVIQQQRISGNMDTPEGGFDAMLQAAVCQSEIGWRPEAKHLLLVMTDQPSHLALDSKLAGIVVPHDGNCHLENNTYTQSSNMEHPSIGQLAEKLLENSIYSIFAVEQVQYKWYEDLIPLLPGTYLGKLLPKASNLKDLVIEAYKKLLSDVEVEIVVQDHQAHRFQFNITALCPDGSRTQGRGKCSNVRPYQRVFFNITMGMKTCPVMEEEVLISVRPVGFNETTMVRVRPLCRCGCSERAGCLDEGGGPACDELGAAADCKPAGANLECSGRGTCVCGKCACDRSGLGTIHGKYCQLDDFSCPYEQGLPCGGRGQCVLGECQCSSGWTGESCGCPTSSDGCLSDDGVLCGGRGRCVCGRCQCDDPRRSGQFCEKCPLCNGSCQSHWRCVLCHLSYGLSAMGAKECNTTCSSTVHYVDDISGSTGDSSKRCLYPTHESCHCVFQMDSMQGITDILISRHPECFSSQRYIPTFTLVFFLTVLLGLSLIAGLKFLLIQRSQTPGESTIAVYHVTKEKSYVPTPTEKMITYRREQPPEMHIHVHKMPLNEAWQ